MSLAALTSAQLRRERKKARRHDVPLVICESCGWTGANHGPRDEWGVSPCPKCGGIYARYADDASAGSVAKGGTA